MLSLAFILAMSVSMVAEGGSIHRQWVQDWGNDALLWVTLCLIPVTWAFDELGRCLMWSRWRGGAPTWQLHWMGVMPVLSLRADEVRSVRRRMARIGVHLWGLLHACWLIGLAWLLSINLSDPAWQWVARAWMYAAAIVLVLVHLNPFKEGALQGLLEEWWQLPDMQGRGRAWWLHQCAGFACRWVGRCPDPSVPVPSGYLPRRAIVLVPLGWCVHWVVTMWMVDWLSPQHPLVALVLWVSVVQALVVLPAWRVWRHTLAAMPEARARWRWRAAMLLTSGALAALILFVPWPRHVLALAVVDLPSESLLVAPVDGVIATEMVASGDQVYHGQVLWSLIPSSMAGVDRDADGMVEAPGGWGLVPIASEGTGRLLWALDGEAPGRAVRQGQLLARVLPPTPPSLTWVLPASRVRDLASVQTLTARLVEQPEQELSLSPMALRPYAVRRLPLAALSARMGGNVAVVDGDKEGLTPAEPMVALTAALRQPLERVGGRAWVKLQLAPQSLGWQWWSRARDLWLAAR